MVAVDEQQACYGVQGLRLVLLKETVYNLLADVVLVLGEEVA